MYKSENFQSSLWLVSLMSIILLMIIASGLTRLTESVHPWLIGDYLWEQYPFIPWRRLKVFEDYKQYPEYQQKYKHDTIRVKHIFGGNMTEVLGRLIGIIFIIPFIYH